MNQHTIKREYRFEGKGLHTGRPVVMRVVPAPECHGIVFQREDLEGKPCIKAHIDNIHTTARSTALHQNGVEVITVEHLLATFWGMGVDNALVLLDSAELPILDGSAKCYAEAFGADGLVEQGAEREYLTIEKPFIYKDEERGAEVTVTPAESFSIDVEIDFNSEVLGVQRAHFDESMDFAREIAPSRTFCFLHELELLLNNNLIKGGDMDNAIVIVENPVSEEVFEKMKTLFNVENLECPRRGYLNNLTLHFPDECARHKLLDVMGDFALVGKFMKANITTKKSGHLINTGVAKALVAQHKG